MEAIRTFQAMQLATACSVILVRGRHSLPWKITEIIQEIHAASLLMMRIIGVIGEGSRQTYNLMILRMTAPFHTGFL